MIPLQDARSIVEKHFRVYEAREEKVRGHVAAQLFFVMFPQEEFDRRYQGVRAELQRRDPETLCFLRREAGEDVLFVAQRPPPTPARVGVHLLLFLLTIATLTMAGTWYWAGFSDPDSGPSGKDLADPDDILGGLLTFALPVLAVLGIHEMGHYIAARRHGLRATLPFFIPFPPIGGLPIGTLGAFISMRDPLPDRKTLFDVGASGPIAGFLVALPLVLVGAWLTEDAGHQVPDLHRPELLVEDGNVTAAGTGAAVITYASGGDRVVGVRAASDLDRRIEHTLAASYSLPNGTTVRASTGLDLKAGELATRHVAIPANATGVTIRVTWDDGLAEFGDPLLVKGLDAVGFRDEGLLTHPTFIAGWVGLLVTGINLLPVSQLDGGHIARAVLGDRMKYAAYAAVGFLILLTLMFGSWSLLAILIVLMGIHHPPPLNDRTPLDRKRLVAAAFVLVLLLVTFVPVPFTL